MVAGPTTRKALVGGFLDRAIAALVETVSDYEIVLVDDGSTDGTKEITQG
jgi:glycosyltransferase involved in cell wall biosynthesis